MITRQKWKNKLKLPYFNPDCPKWVPQNRKLPIIRFKCPFALSTAAHRDAPIEQMHKWTNQPTKLGKNCQQNASMNSSSAFIMHVFIYELEKIVRKTNWRHVGNVEHGVRMHKSWQNVDGKKKQRAHTPKMVWFNFNLWSSLNDTQKTQRRGTHMVCSSITITIIAAIIIITA